MPKVSEIAHSVRSKNAGPFWVTIDLFCADDRSYQHLAGALSTAAVADVLKRDEASIKRFDIATLRVIKLSFPRPVVQGSRYDRDMHGAQYAHLVAEIDLD